MQELFRQLPKQRRLSDYVKEKAVALLRMDANKKKVQQQLIEETGKVILLKDLSNLRATNVSSKTSTNDLDSTVKYLMDEYGMNLSPYVHNTYVAIIYIIASRES